MSVSLSFPACREGIKTISSHFLICINSRLLKIIEDQISHKLYLKQCFIQKKVEKITYLWKYFKVKHYFQSPPLKFPYYKMQLYFHYTRYFFKTLSLPKFALFHPYKITPGFFPAVYGKRILSNDLSTK